MQVVYRRCGGIEIHPKTIVATILITQHSGDVQKERRVFTTMLVDLLALDDWLEECQIEIVAMKSAGIYWRLVFNILATGRTVVHINTRHLSAIPALPGEETCAKDSDWLANMLRHGLLQANFNLPQPLWELREVLSYRKMLVRERISEINHLRKVLDATAPELPVMIRRIDEPAREEAEYGLHDGGVQLPEMAQERLHEILPQLRQALKCRMQSHHRFQLQLILEHIDFLEKSLATFQEEIEKWLPSSDEMVGFLQSSTTSLCPREDQKYSREGIFLKRD